MKSTSFWDVTPCIQANVIDFSEERVASIFRVEVEAKQPAKRSLQDPALLSSAGVTSQKMIHSWYCRGVCVEELKETSRVSV
jgi:hypothetical protein